MGQHMRLIGKRKNKTKTGYPTTIHLYEAQNCQGCPLRGQCHKAQGSRILSVNHRLRAYKEKAKERLTSEKGLEHRRKRPIEPEAVFGQIKYNRHYKRFRHRGIKKINMDFGILAIAFNMAKLFNTRAKSGCFDPLTPKEALFFFSCLLLSLLYRIYGKEKIDKNRPSLIYNVAA
jgi:hypothetical protein